jgi:TonB family protein
MEMPTVRLMDDTGEKYEEHVAAFVRFGSLEQKLGRFSEAERLLTEAVTIGERHLGAEHPSLAAPLNELSRLHIRQSDFARAEPVLERLLRIARAKGERHPDVATALAGLAVAKRGLGDDASAERLYRDALRIREQVLPPHHMAIVVTLEQLGETCAARDNDAEAIVHLQRALLRRERSLGAEHATVHTLRARIADLERRQPESLAMAAARLATPPIPMAEIADAPAIADESRDIWAAPRSMKRKLRFASAGAAAVMLAITGVAFGSPGRSGSEQALTPSAAEPGGAVVSPASNMVSQASVDASAPEARASESPAAPMPTDTQPAQANEMRAAKPSVPVALPSLRRLVVPKFALPSVDSLVGAATKVARGADSDPIAGGGLLTPAQNEDRRVTAPVLISAPTLRFPDELRAQRVEGEVVVELRVNEKGRVEPSSMRVVRSEHELFTAAVRSVLPRFRFEPARSAAPESKPQAAWVQFRAQFTARS